MAASRDDGILEFWYDHASTYSYPAAMRVEDAAAKAGLRVAWRPFLLGPIFEKAYAVADSPFNSNPPRGRYMWRDVERLCAADGIPFRMPSVMPRNSLLAARVAMVGIDDGWVARFSRAVFQANFAENLDIADVGVIAGVLDKLGLGLSSAEILERSTAPAYKPRLRAATTEAAERGIFGAPTFFRLGEMFFGGDRLAQALAWPRPLALM